MTTIKQIQAMAQTAAFFQQEDGLMLRVLFAEIISFPDTFLCHDEDAEEDHWFRYDEVDLTKETFWMLTKMGVPV